MSSPSAQRSFRFGLFELDVARGELRKQGRVIKLQDQPFQVLDVLVRRPGEVVTREELQQAVWPADTFVEFDQGLNTAVKKIRLALVFAGLGAKDPAISQQGRLVYDQLSSRADIWRLELNGARPTNKSAVRLISSTRVNHEPHYSPDGKRIAFGSDRSGNMEIWVADSDGSNATQLTFFGGASYIPGPSWSPDGRWIGFATDSGGNSAAYVISADGGNP